MHVFCMNLTCFANKVSFWVLIDLCCCSVQKLACRRELIQSDLSVIQSIPCALADYKKRRIVRLRVASGYNKKRMLYAQGTTFSCGLPCTKGSQRYTFFQAKVLEGSPQEKGIDIEF